MARFAAVGSTHGLTAWIEHNILGLVILLVGIMILFLARKKNMSDAVTVTAVVLLGLLVVGLAANGNGIRVGQWLAHLVFG